MTNSEKMIAAIQNEQLNESKIYLEKALQEDSLADLYQLADTLYQLGFLPDLERVITNLLEREPENDGLRVTMAEIAIENGEDDKAFDWLFSVDKESEAYPQSLLVQADLYQVQGFPLVSERKLLEAREITQNNPVIEFAIAELYLNLQRYLEASKIYEELLNDGYDQMAAVDLYGRLGYTSSAMGNFKEAIHYLEHSLEKNEDIDSYFQLGIAHMQLENYEEALKNFDIVIEYDPTYSSVYPLMAENYMALQKWTDALAKVETGLTYDQTNVTLFELGAQSAQALKDYGEAEAYYKEALELDPHSEKVRLDYLELLFKLEKYDSLVEVASVGIENEGAIAPEIYWYAARGYNALDEFDKAREAYEHAAPFLEYQLDFLKDYLTFLREEGNWSLMKKYVEKYLEQDDEDMEMQQLKLELEDKDVYDDDYNY